MIVRVAGKVAPGVVSALRNRILPDISPMTLDSAQALLADRVQKVESRQLAELGVVFNHCIPVQLGGRGSLRDIVEVYRSCPDGRLVLTGSPGGGKTVAVLHLLLGLLEDWKKRGTDWRPVPVRVNAASWDGDLSVLDFLTIRVAEVYPVCPRVVRALIETGRILPIIDGLDEMDPPGVEPQRARAAIERLSEGPAVGWPLVVTCRSEVYDQILAKRNNLELRYANRVTVEPLTVADIEDHVQELLDSDDQVSATYAAALGPVLTKLDEDPNGVLATTLATPWLLTLTLAYVQREGHVGAVKLVVCLVIG